jgi:hypothetical protein
MANLFRDKLESIIYAKYCRLTILSSIVKTLSDLFSAIWAAFAWPISGPLGEEVKLAQATSLFLERMAVPLSDMYLL